MCIKYDQYYVIIKNDTVYEILVLYLKVVWKKNVIRY